VVGVVNCLRDAIQEGRYKGLVAMVGRLELITASLHDGDRGEEAISLGLSKKSLRILVRLFNRIGV